MATKNARVLADLLLNEDAAQFSAQTQEKKNGPNSDLAGVNAFLKECGLQEIDFENQSIRWINSVTGLMMIAQDSKSKIARMDEELAKWRYDGEVKEKEKSRLEAKISELNYRTGSLENQVLKLKTETRRLEKENSDLSLKSSKIVAA